MNYGDGDLTANLILKILKKSPEKIQTINLSQNHLGGHYDGRRPFSTDHLISILNALPKSLISLNLSHNYLHWLSADDFVTVIKALPAQLKSLNIASNNLEKYSASDLIKILKALPQDLQSLNLDWMKLHETFSAAEIIEILKALPENLTSLTLRGNSLGLYSHEEQIQIISSLPKQLKHLDLANNFIRNLTGDNLSELFAALPESLVSLSWCENGLNCLSSQELQQAFSSLCTSHLTSLLLSANVLEESKIIALLPFFANSKITFLELKSTFMQDSGGYKGLSKETSDQIQKILWNNQKKSFMNPDPANEPQIYGLQALCGRAITLFPIHFDAEKTTKVALDIIAESKWLIETEGLKVGRY